MNDARGDARDWLSLTLVPGVTAAELRRLLGALGSPQEVLRSSERTLSAVVPAAAARSLKQAADPDALARAVGWLDEPGNRLVTLADADYPALLLEIPDPPLVLYAKGRVELLRSPSIAVVGSRSCTPRGAADAEAFATAIGEAGYTVVSGLALGIDAAAHRGAIATPGSTLAVVGTGLDHVYPASNRELAHDIAARGLIVSEFPLGTRALRQNFPRRNRLISGLSRGVLVVEAAVGSGSLITARLAAEQGREVFAMPGSIHSPHAKGCHALIKQGAKLVESAQDVFEELGRPDGRAGSAVHSQPAATIPSDLAAMDHGPFDVDAFAARAGLPVAAAAARLLELELAGAVATLPGGLFQRLV